MSTGKQRALYRRCRANGLDVAGAAKWAEIEPDAAERIEAEPPADAPPPPSALSAAGPLGVATPRPAEDSTMARAKKQDDGAPEGGGEIKKMDVELALRLYRQDIKPNAHKVGEHAQEMSTAYKAIKKQAHISQSAARLAFKLDGMEPAAREHELRSLRALLVGLEISIPRDLVDVAQGVTEDGVSPIPLGERSVEPLETLKAAE